MSAVYYHRPDAESAKVGKHRGYGRVKKLTRSALGNDGAISWFTSERARMQRLARSLVIAATTFLLLGLAIPAKAVGVDYRMVQMASGTLGGKFFTNVPVSVDFFADTASVFAHPVGGNTNGAAVGGTVQVTVPGIGVAVVTTSALMFSSVTSSQSFGQVPFLDIEVSENPPPASLQDLSFKTMAFASGTSLLNYDLRTAFAVTAVPASIGYLPGSVIHTSLGDLTFSALANNRPTNLGTFSAAIGQVEPQAGLWWNPAESGSGYALDYKHGVLVVTTYSYKADGSAQWYLTSGPVVNNVFTATLDKYTNGQCISCSYTGRPSGGTNDGSMTITFANETSATVKLPGGRVFQIQPQAF